MCPIQEGRQQHHQPTSKGIPALNIIILTQPPPTENYKKVQQPPLQKKISENSGPCKQSTPSTPHPNINRPPPLGRHHHSPVSTRPDPTQRLHIIRKPKSQPTPFFSPYVILCRCPTAEQVCYNRDWTTNQPCPAVWCALLCFALPAGRTNTARSAHVFVKPFPPAGQHVWTFPTNNKTSSEYVTE